MSRRNLTPAQRLHAHIRRDLAGHPPDVIAAAIAIADQIHIDGIGSMQAAIDAAIAHATAPTTPQQDAA